MKSDCAVIPAFLRSWFLIAVYSLAGPSTAACEECGIQVIGAGLGRTGTLSLAAALDILGYKTHHYVQTYHSARWAEWAEGKASSSEMIRLVAAAGFNATVDNPSADLFREQLEEFPGAKVVLTVRDSPKKWEASWKTLFDTLAVTEADFSIAFPSFMQAIPLFRNFKKLRSRMGVHLGLEPGELTHGWRSKPDGWLAVQYAAHNALVKATVPASQLLVLNVREGWEPLCKFLGKPVPDVPFPHINDSAFMRRLRAGIVVAVYSWIPGLALLVVTCCRLCCRAPAISKAAKAE